ncbi:MAG: hypothetical protein JXR68_09690 [Bacteroidales bacterium]|nr:hypothetical protein [Bacteroidales bacterium]
MKNLLKLSVVMFAIVLSFASCKKDKIHEDISIPELYLEIYSGDAVELNFNETHLKVSGRLTPDFEGDEIAIKVITGQYPDGYEIITSVGPEVTREDGDYIYHYRTFATDFQIANHTNDTSDYIKISPNDTQVKIVLGDNLAEKTFPINNNQILKLTYWNINSSTLFLYGYEFDGTETKSIEAWTTRDDVPVTFNMEWSDPSVYNGLPPFNNYTVSIPFWDGWSSQDHLTLGIYYDNTDTIFIKYDGKTYFSVHNITTFEPLTEY